MQYEMINAGGTKESRFAAKWLFLIGMFSQTQISLGGKLGISEFFMAVCAPFLFAKNIQLLRRDGSLTYFCLILMWLAGAIFVDLYTHNYFRFMMRGIAVPITMFANSICIYVLLRKNLDNLKWLLLGVAISGVISIFVFQRGGAGEAAAAYGMEAGMNAVMGYKLFWVFQLTAWLTLPIAGWYIKTSKAYSICALAFLSIFNLVSGGRSAFLVTMVSLLLIIFAGKTRESLQFLKKHIITILILLCLWGVGAKVAYKFAATHGYMGEEERRKYEISTSSGSSALNILMAGRSEFFIGLSAALDKPIMGHGSVAIDNYGYVLDFMHKYSSFEDYNRMMKAREMFGVRIIPAHSHIINYWMWHGIFALLFWMYVFFMAAKTLFLRMYIYPQWFGYLAIVIPSFFWDVLFSPFGARVQEATLFVVLLIIAKLGKTTMDKQTVSLVR